MWFGLLVVDLQVLLVTLRVVKTFATFLTSVGVFSGVNPQVHLQSECFGVAFPTDGAEMWPISGVSSQVHLQVRGLQKGLPTPLTLELPLSRVS